jgi:translation initiation factor IF-1
MQRDDVIEVEAQVMECLPNQLFRLEMINGHRVLGHVGKKLQLESNQILPGMRVRLSLRVFDLSVGSIVGVCDPSLQGRLSF